MNNNAWFKKEIPLQTVIGFGGGATGFGAHSSSATKTYVDDVFSTYLYAGNETARSIDNGIDLSTKNGLVWVKSRNDTHQHHLYDTVRGVNELISTDADSDQSTVTNRVTAFNNNGFSLGTAGQVNGTNAYEYSSWTFREQAGFFDIVQYTGNGSNRNIQHNLGCKPGCIMIKRTDSAEDWIVYHNGFYDFQGSDHYYLKLNSTVAQQYGGSVWNNTAPTTTNFRIGQSTQVNQSGGTYIAYLFGGGSDRTTSTSCSVGFSGVDGDDALSTATSSDFDFGSGDFTVEGWYNPTDAGSNNLSVISLWNFNDNKRSWSISGHSAGIRAMVSPDGQWATRTEILGGVPNLYQWNHIAFTRSGNTLYLFMNGDKIGSASFTGSVYNNSTDGVLVGAQGAADDINNNFKGKLSNIRVVKGTAVYTTSFKPPTVPLTDITNTKFLCCQSSTVTTATVTPGAITAHAAPSASIVTPFTDPGAFKLGENEDQNGIKCDVYQGNGSSTGPEVFIGWEPQYLLIKNCNSAESWALYDSMRGISSGRDDVGLYPNGTYAEYSADVMELTSTGFKLKSSAADVNETNSLFVYIAIRRPDGYVGKLPSAATNVFAMDTWVSDSTPGTQPNMISNFPVDFVLDTDPTYNGAWEGERYVRTRLFSDNYVYANKNDAETYGTWGFFDYSTGWMNRQGFTGYTDWMSWMWKRGQGIDVVTWEGTNSSIERRHNLGTTPEMIWYKNRTSARNWRVYHKGLNGGTNPEDYAVSLNSSSAEGSNTNYMTSTAPTSTHFVSGNDDDTNGAGYNYIAILFASANDADGNPISKVGSYSGSSSSVTVTTGFQPRFVLIKRATGTGQWTMFDTFRGWTAGNDQMLELSDTAAQSNSFDYGEPTATGFTITTGQSATNNNGDTYIYYAHA